VRHGETSSAADKGVGMQARTRNARIPCHRGFPVPVWLEAVTNTKLAIAV
jgi:hypothetical protein